jgi:hypothetical protein
MQSAGGIRCCARIAHHFNDANLKACPPSCFPLATINVYMNSTPPISNGNDLFHVQTKFRGRQAPAFR